VERVVHALAELLVQIRVVGDVVDPSIVLSLVGQLAVDQQVGDLEEGALFGELLDRVAAVAEDAIFPVEFGDGALCSAGGGEARIVEPDPREDLAPFGGVDPAVVNRDLERLTGAVVGDCDALGHDGSPSTPDRKGDGADRI